MLLVAISIQPVVSTLVTRFGLGTIQVAGLLALGIPAPFYGLAHSLVTMLAISAVRGVGFAALTVISTTLSAGLVPAARHGESVALYGLVIAIPAVVAVPIGVVLTQSGHFMVVAFAGALPVLAVPLVAGLTKAPMRSWMLRGSHNSLQSRAKAFARMAPPALCIFAVTLSAGGLSAYLPVEWQRGRGTAVALLLVGGGGVLSRPSGILADRLGTSWLMPLSSVGAALGIALVGVGLHGAPAWVFVGAVIFGISLGSVRSLSNVVIFARAPAGFESVASSLWNVSYDAGTAAGAAFVGIIAGAGLGIPFSIAATGTLIAITLPLSLEWRSFQPRVKHSA